MPKCLAIYMSLTLNGTSSHDCNDDTVINDLSIFDIKKQQQEAKQSQQRISDSQCKDWYIGDRYKAGNVDASRLCDKIVYSNSFVHSKRKGVFFSNQPSEVEFYLSHLGDKYLDGKKVDKISTKESSDIDLFLGGISNYFIEQEIEYKSSYGVVATINQHEFVGIQLSNLQLAFMRTINKNLPEAHTVVIGKNTS